MKSSVLANVVVKCNTCGFEFEIRRKDLAKTASRHGGFVPCRRCNSHATTWDINAKPVETGDV